MNNQKGTSIISTHEKEKKEKQIIGVEKDSPEKQYHRTDEMSDLTYCLKFKKKKKKRSEANILKKKKSQDLKQNKIDIEQFRKYLARQQEVKQELTKLIKEGDLEIKTTMEAAESRLFCWKHTKYSQDGSEESE